ncbi:PadR family transcriptional regulator [Chryseolinea soli]
MQQKIWFWSVLSHILTNIHHFSANIFLIIETYATLACVFLKIDFMKGYIGEFEELVLLTIASLGEDAYGVSIKEDIEKRSDRSISIGALHSTITRLEEKGLIKSWLGEPTQERGGRRKRFFEITHQGKLSLHHIKDLRDELWKLSRTALSLAK